MRRAVVIDGNFAVYEDGTIYRISGGIEIPVELKTSTGYYTFSYKKGYAVHRVIATAFIPNPDNKPEVNHIDGNKLNNAVSNLEWVTYSENTQHAYDNGLISRVRQKGRCNGAAIKAMRIAKDMTQNDLAEITGIHRVTIARYETTDGGMNLETAQKLASALDCTVGDLLPDDKPA